MTAITATETPVRASMFQAIRSGFRRLAGAGSGPKPRRNRRRLTQFENLEGRVVLSWGTVRRPPSRSTASRSRTSATASRPGRAR